MTIKKGGEYRGIEWRNDRDLSIKLDKQPGYVNQIRRHHPERSYEEIIDHALNPHMLEYRGIKWKNDSDLARKLNMSTTYVGRRRSQLNESYEKIIDDVLDGLIPDYKRINHRKGIHTYRGITWTTGRDLSRKLGKAPTMLLKFVIVLNVNCHMKK